MFEDLAESQAAALAPASPDSRSPGGQVKGDAQTDPVPVAQPELFESFSAGSNPQMPPQSRRSDEKSGWKEALRQDFERWLASIDELPEPGGDVFNGEIEAPDLYSLYEQMVAANADARKANRRTAEAFSQWGDTLDRFDGDLRQLREHLTRLSSAAQKEEELPRSVCLPLIEILDRMHRLAAAFASPPPRSRWKWSADTSWRQAWETHRQGFEILVSHLESFLKSEGVTRIETLEKPFDPKVMAAVATESNSKRPHHTIIEEIAAGYFYRGELLRAAQVKVTRGEEGERSDGVMESWSDGVVEL